MNCLKKKVILKLTLLGILSMFQVIQGITNSNAQSAADIEREEAELLASMSTVKILSPEELLRNPDYKKLDQSKLPIEIFDNIEYEAMDKSPEEWLATGSNGKIPYCEDEKWIWKPVTVLGYDSTTKLFDVKYIPDGIRKTASRLNILFDQEKQFKNSLINLI